MSEPIQDPVYHVHFENRNVVFANGIARMFNEGNQFDMSLLVDGKDLKCHRHILSFVSKQFGKQLEDRPTFGSSSAEWQGGNYEATKGILNYIYNGSVEVYKRDLETFVDASQFLDISTNLQDLNLTDIMSGMNDIIPAEIIWNNWGEDFVSGFQSLYAEKKHFDVTLQINGRELKAHRHVLSACSKYFEPIFSCVGIENPITVLLNDLDSVTYDMVRKLLQFIYYGEVKVNDLVLFLNAAEELQIIGLLQGDSLQTERPTDGASHSNIFQVYARAQEFTDKRIDMNVERRKVSKVTKSRRDVEQSDSEDEKMVIRRRNLAIPKVKGANPKTMTTSKPKLASNQPKTPKLASKKVDKARAIPKKVRFADVPRINEQFHVEPVSKEASGIEFALNEDEIELLCADQSQNELETDEEETCQKEENDNEVETDLGQTEKVYSILKKNGREDWNNNELENASCSYGMKESSSHKYDIEDYTLDHSSDKYYLPEHAFNGQTEYEDDSDNGAVGEPLVLYERYGYKTKAGSVQNKFGHGTSSNVYATDEATHEYAKKQTPKAKPKVSSPTATGGLGKGWSRGMGKNAIPLNDEAYTVQANIIATKRSPRVLAHDGYRYRFQLQRIGCMRWLCNQSKKRCFVLAYTKVINGVTMVSLPPNDMHNHDPPYASDFE